MRHLGSIVLSVILAAIVYVLSGVGITRLTINANLVAHNFGTNWTDVGVGAGAVVVAGALYAVLTLVRFSPLGPVIAGLIYIGVQLWALFDLKNITSTLPDSIYKSPGAAEAPLTGLTLLLAIPLLATIFSPRRWRGKDAVAVGTTPYAPPVGASTYAQPSVPQPGFGQPAVPQTAPQPTYAQPEPTGQTYAAPPTPASFPEPTYSQQTYAQPTSAAPAYTSLPEPVAPQQTTAETAADADEPTSIDPGPDAPRP